MVIEPFLDLLQQGAFASEERGGISCRLLAQDGEAGREGRRDKGGVEMGNRHGDHQP